MELYSPAPSQASRGEHGLTALDCRELGAYLCVDDYYARFLTLKELSEQRFPLIFKGLLDVDANDVVATEWKKADTHRLLGGD